MPDTRALEIELGKQLLEGQSGSTPDTKNYKLLVGTHTTGGVNYRAGYSGQDILPLTDKQVEALGDRVRLVTSDETQPQSDSASGSTINNDDLSDEITDLLSRSVSDIESELADVDDVGVLDAIGKEESKGKNRVGVFNAIRNRKAEIENEDGA